MKILISGSSGFLGQELKNKLIQKGHQVFCLVRRDPLADEIFWNPREGVLDSDSLEGFDVVYHLAGAGVADKIWTKNYQEIILKSRVVSTKLLCSALAQCKQKPQSFISSSGVNFYGDQQEHELDEDSPKGSGFLSEVCAQWEQASEELESHGIRRIFMRTSVVLDPSGGMLKKILPSFKLFIGGTIGLGQRYFPWISLTDMTRLFLFILENKDITGPVNAVAPHIISNREFTFTLAKKLKRPALVPVPSPLLKLLPNKMADGLFLCDLKIKSTKLDSFNFTHPNLSSFLQDRL